MSRFLRGKTSNNDNHYCYRVTHLDGSKLEIAFERSISSHEAVKGVAL